MSGQFIVVLATGCFGLLLFAFLFLATQAQKEDQQKPPKHRKHQH